MSSLNIPSSQSDIDRQSHQSPPSFRTEAWITHPYATLGAHPLTTSDPYSTPQHHHNRVYHPGPTSDNQTEFHHNRELSSYAPPTQYNTDGLYDAGSRYQAKRFNPYMARNPPMGTVSAEITNGYHGHIEELPYNDGCLDNARTTYGEQSWDLSTYCIPAACNDTGYYHPNLFHSTMSYDPFPTHMNTPPVQGYAGDAHIQTNQTQPRIHPQTYVADHLMTTNETIRPSATLPQQRRSPNTVDDSSLYRHFLDGDLTQSHGFMHYLPTPTKSPVHPSTPANTSFPERSNSSTTPSIGWVSHVSSGHRGPDPPEVHKRNGTSPPSTSPRFPIHSEWESVSAAKQQPETLTLPSSSSPIVAAPTSSQSILKLNHHAKKTGSSEKKQTLACLFCRERKIACGRPAEGSLDSTCNQCARRQFKCEYPKESRRGQHKRNRRKTHDVNDAY